METEKSTSAPQLFLRPDLLADALLLLPEFGSELGAEVVRLEHLTDLDFGFSFMGIGAALHPLDGLFHRSHLPKPEAGNQFLRLSEWPIDHRPLRSRELDACALRARPQPFAREHDAGFRQLFIEFAHISKKLFARHNSRL